MLGEPSPSSPPDPSGGPWYAGLTRYHLFVLTVASLGWLFDTMDQRIFLMSRQPAMTDLLGYELGAGGKLSVRGGPTLSDEEVREANEEITWYSSLATTIFMLGWATGGLYFGIMGDRWGRARTMLLTILLYSLFTGLSALSQSWWDFMVYRFITGMGVGGEFAAGVSLVAEVMPARARPFALGLLQALSAVGNIAGSLLSGLIMHLDETVGWRFTFLIGTLPALLVVAVMRRLKEPETWQKARADLELALEAERKARANLGLPGPGEKRLGSVGDILREPRWRRHTIVGVLLATAGVIGLWGVGFWTFELITKVMTKHGASPGDVNRVKAIGTSLQDVGAFFGIFVFSIVTAYVGRRLAFAGAFAAGLAATVLVFGFLETETEVYWMLPILGFCNLAVFGGYAIYFPELYPTRLRSTGTGFCYNVARYLAAVGPFTLGGLVSLYGSTLGSDVSPDMPFRYAALTVASIYLLGILVVPFAPETAGKPLPEE
jgi:MFS family permease